MKFTSREIALSWVIVFLLLFSFSYWIAAPQASAWRANSAARQQTLERIALAERLLEQRPQWSERLDVLTAKLSKYAPDQDVTADYLKILERIAKDNQVNLVQRRPQNEKRHGDLYELAIECTWEADLASLVHFLYALEEEKNVAMDIESISLTLLPGAKSQMKGNFTLICVYSRAPGAPTQ